MLKKHIKKQRQQPLQLFSNLKEKGESVYCRSHKSHEKTSYHQIGSLSNKIHRYMLRLVVFKLCGARAARLGLIN